MKTTKLALLITTALLSGCMSRPISAPSIAFNYKATNAVSVGIVQVFEMSGNTVVQIKNLQERAPLFLAEGNTELKYQMMGENAVLPGIVRNFTVVSAGAWSQVTRQTGVEASIAAGKVPPVSPVQAKHTDERVPSDDELRALIATMKAEIAALKKSMAQPTSDAGATGPVSAPPATQDRARPNYAPVSSIKESTTLRVTFKNNSADFEPRAAIARTLINLAEQATEISVTGYTDSTVPSTASSTLAKGRAIAARQYLMSKGIDPAKIAIAYKPSGGFVMDNSTKDGRAENRRVEIELL